MCEGENDEWFDTRKFSRAGTGFVVEISSKIQRTNLIINVRTRWMEKISNEEKMVKKKLSKSKTQEKRIQPTIITKNSIFFSPPLSFSTTRQFSLHQLFYCAYYSRWPATGIWLYWREKDVNNNNNQCTLNKWKIETWLNYINKFRISDKFGDLSATKLLWLMLCFEYQICECVSHSYWNRWELKRREIEGEWKWFGTLNLPKNKSILYLANEILIGLRAWVACLLSGIVTKKNTCRKIDIQTLDRINFITEAHTQTMLVYMSAVIKQLELRQLLFTQQFDLVPSILLLFFLSHHFHGISWIFLFHSNQNKILSDSNRFPSTLTHSNGIYITLKDRLTSNQT